MRKPLLALAGAAAVVALQAAPAAASTADLDCADFDSQAEALAELGTDDPHGLDEDDDGVPCEADFGEVLLTTGDDDDQAAGGSGGGDDMESLPRTGPEDQLALAGGALVVGGATLVLVSRKRHAGRHVAGA